MADPAHGLTAPARSERGGFFFVLIFLKIGVDQILGRSQPPRMNPMNTLESAALAASTLVLLNGKKLNTAVWTSCEDHLIADPKNVSKVFKLTEARIADATKP